MGALLGAGVFGLVPHPLACLEPYRHDRRGRFLTAEDDAPLLRGVQHATTREQIAQRRPDVESARLGGGVQ
jgi:hypothetical protein